MKFIRTLMLAVGLMVGFAGTQVITSSEAEARSFSSRSSSSARSFSRPKAVAPRPVARISKPVAVKPRPIVHKTVVHKTTVIRQTPQNVGGYGNNYGGVGGGSGIGTSIIGGVVGGVAGGALYDAMTDDEGLTPEQVAAQIEEQKIADQNAALQQQIEALQLQQQQLLTPKGVIAPSQEGVVPDSTKFE